MKSLAANAFYGETTGQGERLSQIGLRTMEGRVEAGDLRNLRRRLHDRVDRRKVVRLMEGRERFEFREVVEHGLCHPHRRGIVKTAMDNAVTKADYRPSFKQRAPGRDDFTRGCGMIVALHRKAPLLDRCACSIDDLKMWLNANPLNLSAEEEALRAVRLIEGKLYAR